MEKDAQDELSSTAHFQLGDCEGAAAVEDATAPGNVDATFMLSSVTNESGSQKFNDAEAKMPATRAVDGEGIQPLHPATTVGQQSLIHLLAKMQHNNISSNYSNSVTGNDDDDVQALDMFLSSKASAHEYKDEFSSNEPSYLKQILANYSTAKDTSALKVDFRI
jgi:ankyrin repeat protein